jgi:P-type Cu+ transporter
VIKTVTDPVCGMVIEPAKAAAETTYRGQTYYFCSQECKAKFDKDPQKYANQVQQPEHRH